MIDIINGQFDIPFSWPSYQEAKNECRKCMWLVHVVKIKGCLMDPEAVEGIIKIKCPICKGVIAVSFHKKKIRTERIGA